MERFEYEVTLHPAERFTQLVYFCTSEGDCALKNVPQDQINILKGMLNEKGAQGWEIVNLFPGKDGLMVLWKRRKRDI